MPTTLTAFLIMLFALLPGLPGQKIYQLLIGRNWREETWQKILTIMTFSLLGLGFYVILARLFNLWYPQYLSTQQLEAAVSLPVALPSLFVPLMGHFTCSSVVGIVTAILKRRIIKLAGFSAFHSSWDHLLYDCASERWMVVGLKSGDSYAGFVETADPSVKLEERDLILREPAAYDRQKQDYISIGYQFLYLPGEFVASIGVVYSPVLDSDSRISSVGQPLFSRGNTNDHDQAPAGA